MPEPRKFRWLGGTALLLAGSVAAFLVFRNSQWFGFPLTSVAQQTSQGQWGIQADFKLQQPIFVNDLNKTQILSFKVGRSKNAFTAYPVSIKNLSDRPYFLTYEIYAFDAQNQRIDEATDNVRIDEATDNVMIGAKELVVRPLNFTHPLSVDAQTFEHFRLIAKIEH